MKRLFLVMFMILLASCSSGPVGTVSEPLPQPQIPISTSCTHSKKLNSPWNDTKTSIVIDAYEGNPIDWVKMATDKRVIGVIHRSAQGLRVDKQYSARREIAKQRGYLWGAYHLGDRSDPIKQAELLLSQTDPETLLILDLEDTGSTRFMTLDQAKIFMDYVFQKTGKIPVVYANHSTTKLLNQKFKNDPVFQKAKLWYARFKSNVADFPNGIWPGYWLWQFSSEINCSKTGSCLYNVSGTLSDMDVNVFDGGKLELEWEWNNRPCKEL